MGIRTKKGLAGGTDGLFNREAQQNTSPTCQLHGTDRKGSSGELEGGWRRWTQVRDLQPDSGSAGNGLRMEGSVWSPLKAIYSRVSPTILVGIVSQCELIVQPAC